MAERRKLKRQKTSVFFGIYERNSGDYFGRLVDITVEGIMLISEKPISTELVYQFRMDLPVEVLESKHITFDAEARWCKRDKDDGLFDTGFQFTRISPRDIEVIEHLMANFMDTISDCFTTVTVVRRPG